MTAIFFRAPFLTLDILQKRTGSGGGIEPSVEGPSIETSVWLRLRNLPTTDRPWVIFAGSWYAALHVVQTCAG